MDNKSELFCIGKICIGGLISVIVGIIFFGSMEIFRIIKNRLTGIKIYGKVRL